VAARVQSATGLKNALVWLAVKSVPVHRVYVEGEVVRPEAVLLPQDHDLTLAAALALVGGPSEDADLTQLKLVREEAGGKRRIFVVDGSVLLMRGSGEVGPVLKPGDLIVVPRAESFTVTGEISKVGVYSRKDTRVAQGQPIRLSHAIAAAGGVKPLADRQVVRIIRTDEQGRRLVLVCDLEAAVEKGDLTQDAVLQDGDQILVPAHEGILLMGRVAASGIYYPVGGPMTVSRLLAMGGGFTSYAKRNAVLVIRKDTPAQPIRVDMKLIMEEGRGDLDITLKPGDMVFVGGEAPL
jgi:protein involved in polysaccharide export with SLBB domain